MKTSFLPVVILTTCLACSGPVEKTTQKISTYELTAAVNDLKWQEHRVNEDPGGALGWSQLSAAHLKNARIFDSTPDAVQAEAAAMKSLEIRRLGNVSAMNHLIQSLLAQHHFDEALELSQKAISEPLYDNTTLQLCAQLGMEVGDYDLAQRVVAKNREAFVSPSGQLVLGRLLWISGNTRDALRVTVKAMDEVVKNPSADSDVKSWFLVRNADLNYSCGKTEVAKKGYEQALTYFPNNYKAQLGLIKIAFRSGDWKEVIERGTECSKIAVTPDILSMMGDASKKLGLASQAQEYYSRLIVTAKIATKSGLKMRIGSKVAESHGHSLDRQFAQFCSNHETRLDEGYAAAMRDLSERQDIFAWDTVAWINYKMGKLPDAQKAMRKAIKFGTEDVDLLNHARIILGSE